MWHETTTSWIRKIQVKMVLKPVQPLNTLTPNVITLNTPTSFHASDSKLDQHHWNMVWDGKLYLPPISQPKIRLLLLCLFSVSISDLVMVTNTLILISTYYKFLCFKYLCSCEYIGGALHMIDLYRIAERWSRRLKND